MSRPRRVLLVCMLAACVPAMAGELLMTGHIRSVLLQPEGAPGCPDPRLSLAKAADGMSHVVVSNGCGCVQTRIAIDRVLLGQRQDDPRDPVTTFNTELGEWCKAGLPPGREPVLIDVRDGDLRWFSTERRGETLFVAPREIGFIGGVNVKDMVPDEDGLVPLDEVLDMIRQASDKKMPKN